jgi:hypothetical protein
MRTHAPIPFGTRDVRLDLFRGLANWAIFLDHIPHEVLSSFTTRNYGFSDAADLFVFISGYTAAMVFGKVMIERGYLPAALKLAWRAFQLYAAHVAVVAVYIAVIAWVSRVFHDPDDLNQFNVAVFISMPFREFIQTLALRYRPVNLDVLPLYILLLGTFAPALWMMIRHSWLAVMASMAVYFASRHFGWNLTASPSGIWYFNPFTWQLLFFLGAWIALGGAEAIQSVIRTRTVFWLAIAYLAFACVVTLAIQNPGLGSLLPHWMLSPFDPNDKTNLAPYRVVHLISLAIVVTRFLRLESPILQWRPLAPLIVCGRNSLQVFCVGIVLSFCAHAAIERSLNALVVQISVGAAGMLLMTAFAYCRTWSKARRICFTGRTWRTCMTGSLALMWPVVTASFLATLVESVKP